LESSENFEVSGSRGGSGGVFGKSVVTLSGPGIEKLSESGRLRGVHGSSGVVSIDDALIVKDVRLQGSLSLNGIASLVCESSKLLSPSGNSRVL